MTIGLFQEGNLPNSCKCVKCKKSCWNQECLTGMRCQWCGMSAHSSCLPNLPASNSVCQFGLLEPIFLPPLTISMPRTQLTQDRVISKSHALMQARMYTSIYSFIVCFVKWPCFDQLHAHILECQQNSKRTKMCAFS